MVAELTLPYLSHKMVKIMFLLEYLHKFSFTNNINNVWALIMVCYSSCQPFPSIYNFTICIRIIFTRFEAGNKFVCMVSETFAKWINIIEFIINIYDQFYRIV